MCEFIEDRTCEVETVEFHDRIEIWKNGQLVEVIPKHENKEDKRIKCEYHTS